MASLELALVSYSDSLDGEWPRPILDKRSLGARQAAVTDAHPPDWVELQRAASLTAADAATGPAGNYLIPLRGTQCCEQTRVA